MNVFSRSVLVSSPQKGSENRNGTLWRREALLWHVSIMALETTPLNLSISVQEGQIPLRVQVENSKNETMWNVYNVIIYDILMNEVTADLFPESF